MTEPNNNSGDDHSSDCSTENYQELGYEPINDYCDGEDENSSFEADFSEIINNFEEEGDQSKELTFENFDVDFEKALSFVLQNTMSNEPHITTIRKKRIKITLGEKDPSQKIQYISHEESRIEGDTNNNIIPEETHQTPNDIEMNKESVESIKNIIRDLNFTPTKPATWISEDYWLLKLKKIKDEN
nr:unnamed protein product [Naegleria fowleri]